MKVLVVGSGGREHAICRALATSPAVEVLVAPGNPGTAYLGRNLEGAAADVAGLTAAARDHQVDLGVPGPESSLVLGLADALREAGIPCCGPSAAAARLEGSKWFTRRLTDAAGVPSPAYRVVTEPDEVDAAVTAFDAPPVVKADGLAAGKGVIIAETVQEAEAAVDDMLEARRFGDAGAEIVVEECLVGEEASFFALVDGETALPLTSAQDHKRVGDGDTGPNTGGMGAYSPAPVITEDVIEAVVSRVLQRLSDRVVRARGHHQLPLVLRVRGVRHPRPMEEEGKAPLQAARNVRASLLPRAPLRKRTEPRQVVPTGKFFDQQIGERRGRFTDGEARMTSTLDQYDASPPLQKRKGGQGSGEA